MRKLEAWREKFIRDYNARGAIPYISPVDGMTNTERINYLREYMAGIMRSVNYFRYAGSSFNLKPRERSIMERFAEKVCDTIARVTRRESVYKDEEELRRLLKAFEKYAGIYKRELWARR